MQGHTFDFGARFLIGVPHPTGSAEGFLEAALLSADVRRALRGARYRALSVRAHEEIDERGDRVYCRECEAVLYDYTRNRTVRVRGLAARPGRYLIEVTPEQPLPSREEFRDAVALVAEHPVWGPLLQAGHVSPYEPMPPMLEPEGGESVERTLYVGLISRPRRFNRIIAVNMVRREVSRTEVTPRGSRAGIRMCGVPNVPCFRPGFGTPGTATIEWPAENPVWRFQAVRPTASSGVNGSGIELRNVRYRGRRVLKQAHMPILNVKYAGDTCGPFRDWMWEETCFEAVGQDIPGARGFRWCTQPPRTILEKQQDGGNFAGVAVYESAEGALVLVSQLAAGWYRYIMEWRFHPDGRILPRMSYDAVADSCTCESHTHHSYWRLDFDVIRGGNVVQQFLDGAWVPVRQEISVRRQEGVPTLWRVIDPRTGAGYEIIPGAEDGVGDLFSGDDQYVLKRRSNEIDDRRGGVIHFAEAELARFVGRDRVFKKDCVIWYAAHFGHSLSEVEALHADGVGLGPTLQPVQWPG